MQNPYQPMPMRIERVVTETDDGLLKSFDLVFEREEDAQRFRFQPGQFCELSIFGKGEAPFGIASAPYEGAVRFTINRIGVFTRAIHAMGPGDVVGMRGPLGNGYPVEAFEGRDVVIIGGGYAFTTLRSLTLYLLQPEVRSKYGRVTVIYGARRPGLLLYRDELEDWEAREDVDVHLTIDRPADGWTRHVGFVPDVTREVAPEAGNAVAVVCGPPVMIKFTIPVLNDLGFAPERVFLSLEKRMKCGIGKCGRCNIGPKYICKDGPVFSYAELQALPADL